MTNRNKYLLKHIGLVSMLLITLVTAPLSAGTLKSKGEISFENRFFQGDSLDVTKDGNQDLFTRLESRFKKKGFRAAVRVFGRVDGSDSERSLFAVEEAWVGYRKSGWDIRAGYQMLNWSATEAFHPADMINSRNLDSDLEKQEKRGELMVSVKRKLGNGSITAFLMPRYQAPVFPSSRSRLNVLPPGVEMEKPLWLESNGTFSDDRYGLQWGARLTQTVGAADFTIHYIQHQDRHQPLFLPNPGTGKLHPLYLQVQEIGGTYLQVFGPFIVKLELNYRDFDNPRKPVETIFAGPLTIAQPDHGQAALGIEYGWSYGSGSEGTVIIEGQGLLGVDKMERAHLHPFQRDILLGYRHAWNDIMSRELLVTTIFDVEGRKEVLVNVSYKQRLSDTWGVGLGVRIIDAPPKSNRPTGLEALHKSNQVYMTLSKYF